jgi:hypothetical protein
MTGNGWRRIPLRRIVGWSLILLSVGSVLQS